MSSDKRSGITNDPKIQALPFALDNKLVLGKISPTSNVVASGGLFEPGETVHTAPGGKIR